MTVASESDQLVVAECAPASVVSSGRSDRIRFAGLLPIWAMWFGLFTGYTELLNLGVKRYVLDRLVLLGPHTLWLAPFADATLFVLLGTLLLPVTVFLPTRLSQPLGVFAFSFTCVASLVLFWSEIHTDAAFVLAGGAAMQMTRSISARLDVFGRLVRRTLPWMLAASLGLAVAVPTWLAWSESRALRALPRPPESSPNVLLIVWDTVRAKSLSTYGYERDTSPNLSELGQNGIVFERAVATAPWTLPSHASMFTGHWAHELSATWDVPLDETYPTLAEALTTRGYMTAGFVANQLYCSHIHGLSRGFLHYDDFNVIGTEFVLSCQLGRQLTESRKFRRLMGWKDFWGRKSAERMNWDFLRWIDKRPNRPWFAFLNYFDAHDPYLPPPPFDRRFGPSELRKDFHISAQLRSARTRRNVLTAEELLSEQDAYDGAIAYMDDCLWRLIGELERRGILSNTIVIVTSDHGEQFGEHGHRGHGDSLYRPLIHVPLVIRCAGGAPSGLRFSHIVSLRDLPATVIDLVGCADESVFPGQTVRRFWKDIESRNSSNSSLYASVRPRPDIETWDRAVEAVIAEGLHYIEFGDGHEELYDFENDPREAEDLVSAGDVQDVLSRFRSLIKDRRKE